MSNLNIAHNFMPFPYLELIKIIYSFEDNCFFIERNIYLFSLCNPKLDLRRD